MTQLGFELAVQGATRAADHADKEILNWSDRAYAVFCAFANVTAEFTNEDVVKAAVTLPAPPEKRAWGAIALRAQRAGIVKSVGYSKSTLAHAHRRPITLWKSLTCKAAA